MTETIKSPNGYFINITPPLGERNDNTPEEGVSIETPREISESWRGYLEHLQDVAQFCMWDGEQNRPVVDPKTIDNHKKIAAEQALQEAISLVSHSKECGDEEIVDVIEASLIDNTDRLHQVEQKIDNLRHRLSLANTDSQRQRIARALDAVEKTQSMLSENTGKIDTVLAKNRVAQILEKRAYADIDDKAMRAPEELERAIADRIAADRYPWTMPGAENIDPDKMDNIRKYHRTLIEHQSLEYATEDEVRIPNLLPDDTAFLEGRGVVPIRGSKIFSREALRRAGIFFINTVGEGEQPIFSEVITDREGQFDPKGMVFLTEEEFSRVYSFQQREGYGIDGLDPDDVVMDMIVADQVRTNRYYNLIGSERINKYGQTSSLFVSNKGGALPSSFGGYFEINKKQYRLSSVQADLINGHRDFPGVSEMYQSSCVAWDQRYMTASRYVEYIYSPLPTRKEAFCAIKDGASTKRERDWLGVPVFIVETKDGVSAEY